MAVVDVDGSSLQADSQPKLTDLAEGWWPFGIEYAYMNRVNWVTEHYNRAHMHDMNLTASLLLPDQVEGDNRNAASCGV